MAGLFLKAKKQRGSTLIVVVVCMLFLSIIAAIVLTVTTKNLSSGRAQTQESEAFHTADGMMALVETRIKGLTGGAIKEAYVKWLANYSSYADDERKNIFFEKVKDELALLVEGEIKDVLAEGPATPDGSGVEDTLFADALGVGESLIWNHPEAIAVSLDTTAGADAKIRVSNVSITYTDASGAQTTISTDIILTITFPGFNNILAKSQQICSDFVVVADEQIVVNAGATTNIVGSVYGGGYDPLTGLYDSQKAGIKIDGANVKLNSPYIITRTQMQVSNYANVEVAYATNIDSNPELWAENVLLDKGNLNMSGEMNIADDLTLEQASTCILGSDNRVPSKYLGYSYSSTGAAKDNSAIIINGIDSVLDFSNARDILVAGRSFISVPEYNAANPGARSVHKEVMQGESISFKGMQSLYLMPGECINDIGHNPLTEDDWRSLDFVNKEADAQRLAFDFTKAKSGLHLEDYINATGEYTNYISVVPVRYLIGESSSTYYYLYLKFKTESHAARYFEDYSSTNSELIQTKMNLLDDGKILFNPATVRASGAVVGYDDAGNITIPGNDLTEAGSKKYSIGVSVLDYADEMINASGDYKCLATTLSKSSLAGDMENGRVTEYVAPGIKRPTPMEKADNNLASAYKFVMTTEADYHVPDGFKGLIVATGDVTVSSGTFKGLIIAGGTVTLGTCNLQYDPYIETMLLNHPEMMAAVNGTEADDNPEELEGEGGSESMTYAMDLISIAYENWRKN